MEMYKPNDLDMSEGMKVEDKLKEHTNFQKKQQSIVFIDATKTPFEKELDSKANEIKNQKKKLQGNFGTAVELTQEQTKL